MTLAIPNSVFKFVSESLFKSSKCHESQYLTLSWRRSLSYRNLCHEKVKEAPVIKHNKC